MPTWSFRSRASADPKANNGKLRLLLITFVAYLLISPVVMLLLELLSIRVYLLSSFCWFLISSEVFAPQIRGTTWWNRIQWIKLWGWIVVIYIVTERFNAVLA
ncbi:hypothetical protein DJ75_14055 [Halorubrum sp. Eb13]|nr:hypothetical protein DJ75_14055 [Halorubrum sp. Eb13]